MNVPMLISSAVVGGLTIVLKPGILLPSYIAGMSPELVQAVLAGGAMYLLGSQLFQFAYATQSALPSTQKIQDKVTGINGTTAAANVEQHTSNDQQPPIH